jgi:MEKHLA domain
VVHDTPKTPEPQPANAFLRDHAELLCASYRRWTGRELLTGVDSRDIGRALYEAPFVVASHGIGPDPVFNYANRKALELWEADWATFTAMPSRRSAEPVEQGERRRFLAQVSAHGFVDDYSGIRISTRGRRFRIRRATVWNVLDAGGVHRGQAVVFRVWEYL